MIPEDADFRATKLEEINTSNTSRISSNSTASSWSKLKDPRIVRVVRAFGGKDRHSKVFTVRGLRDRRVRLSVPTAIQLYDLQERLGLNQPSKAVDWLLNEAKHAIDELPPLQIPQGSLISQSLHQYHPMFMNDSQLHRHEFLSPQSTDGGLKISSGNICWGKDKDVSGGTSSHRNENWGRNQEEERSQLQQMHDQNQSGFPSSTSNFFLRQSLPSGILPHNPFFRWDPSNMILPHDPQRSHEPSTSQTNNEDRNFSLVQLPSISSGSHPVLVYHQPGMSSTTHSFNSGPSQISGTNTGFESKQAADFHIFQLSNSSHTTSPVDSNSQPVRPFQFSMTANLLPPQSSSAVDEQNSNNQFHSS